MKKPRPITIKPGDRVYHRSDPSEIGTVDMINHRVSWVFVTWDSGFSRGRARINNPFELAVVNVGT